MFPDEYLQYIIDLPIQPKENINEKILPKWVINPSLNQDTIPILTGCKYAKYCKELQCPYLHPKYEHPETNTIQVNNIDHNVYTMIDNISYYPTYYNYGKHIQLKNIISTNINTSENITAQAKTRGVPKPKSQGASIPGTQTLQGPDRLRTRRERTTTFQGQTRVSTDREGTTSLKGPIRVHTGRDEEEFRLHKRLRRHQEDIPGQIRDRSETRRRDESNISDRTWIRRHNEDILRLCRRSTYTGTRQRAR